MIIVGAITKIIYNNHHFALVSPVISLVNSWSMKLGNVFSKLHEVETFGFNISWL